MATETPAAPAAPAAASPAAPQRIELRVAAFVLALLPGALVVYFGFNGGGFFPGTVGFACVIVIQLLILRVLLGDHPFEGFNRRVALVGVPLAGFATWVLASAIWSDTQDRALIEFDRALLYLLLFLLFALVARSRFRIRWMVRGLALAIFVCSAVGLFSRLRPDVLHRPNDVAISRLAYPLTYWNALGILAVVGILLLLGLAASRTEGRIVRSLAAGGVPILAATLYFTFSRGALLAVAVGLVVYVVAARSRGLPGTLLATVPTTAFAIVAAYGQSELASSHPNSALGASQGEHLLRVLVVWAVVAALVRAVTVVIVDRRLGQVHVTPGMRRSAWLAAGGAAICAIAAAIALGGPGWISKQYHQFAHGKPTNDTSGDLRARLTDPSSNGRIDHWRVAVDAFDAQPLHGSGAGTYEFVWHRRRHSQTTVVDGHSLYVEAMGEYGLVGLVLLVASVLGLLVAIAARIRGENHVLYASVLAAGVAWAVHAGVDWDWEMPAVTAWLFACGGAAVARRADRAGTGVADSVEAQRARVPVAAALIVIAALPALILFSQSRLTDSAHAFIRGDCKTATKDAFASIGQLSLRPEPYRIVGYCDIKEGRPQEAIAAMRKAVDASPRNWESHYGLAIALAAAGRDPRAEIARTRRMNPLETFVKSAAAAFRTPSPALWRREAATQMKLAFSTGRLTFR